MVRHLPSAPCTMLAITAWVWSWGSRLREVSWRKVAATIFWSPARARRPVSGSFIRVSTACFSIQARVAATARSWTSTTRPSPPTRPMSETDFGVERVTSRPGRWTSVPSPSRRPSARPEPSGTLPSSTARKVCGSTGPESPRASAPFPDQPLASPDARGRPSRSSRRARSRRCPARPTRWRRSRRPSLQPHQVVGNAVARRRGRGAARGEPRSCSPPQAPAPPPWRPPARPPVSSRGPEPRHPAPPAPPAPLRPPHRSGPARRRPAIPCGRVSRASGSGFCGNPNASSPCTSDPSDAEGLLVGASGAGIVRRRIRVRPPLRPPRAARTAPPPVRASRSRAGWRRARERTREAEIAVEIRKPHDLRGERERAELAPGRQATPRRGWCWRRS